MEVRAGSLREEKRNQIHPRKTDCIIVDSDAITTSMTKTPFQCFTVFYTKRERSGIFCNQVSFWRGNIRARDRVFGCRALPFRKTSAESVGLQICSIHRTFKGVLQCEIGWYPIIKSLVGRRMIFPICNSKNCLKRILKERR